MVQGMLGWNEGRVTTEDKGLELGGISTLTAASNQQKTSLGHAVACSTQSTPMTGNVIHLAYGQSPGNHHIRGSEGRINTIFGLGDFRDLFNHCTCWCFEVELQRLEH